MRLSKNSVDQRRDGGTVSEIRWVFHVLWVVSCYCEHSAATTTTGRESYIPGRAPVTSGYQDYSKILLIGEDMVGLWVVFRVLGYTKPTNGRFRPPTQQQTESRTGVEEHRQDKANRSI